MKKIITPLILCFILALNSASAQEGPYITVFGGFGLAASSINSLSSDGVVGIDTLAVQSPGDYQWFDENSTISFNGDGEFVQISDYAVSTVNLGKGANFGVSIGMMFNDNIGAELGFGYLLGSKTKFKQVLVNEIDPENIETYTLTGEIHANQFRLIPSLVISTDFRNFIPYAKFGVVIGLGTKITETYDDNEYLQDSIVHQVFTSKGGIAFGVSGTLGALYQFNKKTGIFLELTTTAMSYSPKTRTLTAYSINTVDELNDLIPLQTRETEYVDDIKVDSQKAPDPTQTTLAAKIKYPMSTFDIKLGLRFSF
jgi:opacity protein-like surface antigen